MTDHYYNGVMTSSKLHIEPELELMQLVALGASLIEIIQRHYFSEIKVTTFK